MSDLVKAKAPDVDAEVRAWLDATMDALNAMYLRALTTESYDQMIGEGNDAGNAVVERAVTVLKLKSIEFEGSDSLDSQDKFQGDSAAASESSGDSH